MIITLCGSARFEQAFKDWSELLGLNGHAAFTLAVYPSDKGDKKDWYTQEQKRALDLCHFEKIIASRAVLILNVGGYIGESTSNELAFARRFDKLVYWLEEDAERRQFGDQPALALVPLDAFHSER